MLIADVKKMKNAGVDYTRCANCTTRSRLTVHHLLPQHYKTSPVYDLYGDIMPLCRPCHDAYELEAVEFRAELWSGVISEMLKTTVAMSESEKASVVHKANMWVSAKTPSNWRRKIDMELRAMFPNVQFGFVIHVLNSVNPNAVVSYYGMYRLHQAWQNHFNDFLNKSPTSINAPTISDESD